MKKLLALILAICMALSLAACGNSATSSGASTNAEASNASTSAPDEAEPSDAAEAPAEEAVSGDRATTASTGERYPEITIALSYFPASSAPTSDPVDGFKTFGLVYQSLFEVSGDEYIGVLAKGYEIVDDTHYNVEIYDYIFDSAGNHITASDVVFSYENLVASGMARGFDAFAGVEEIDEYTVQFTFNYPLTQVQALASIWSANIVSEAAFTASSDGMSTTPVGTGPYTCTEFITDSSITLEARDDYWQTDESLILDTAKSTVQTFNIVCIPEAAQNVMALANGSIDVSLNIPYTNLGDFEAGGQYAANYNLYTYDGTTNTVIAANQSSGSPCQDVNLRKAIFYAIDSVGVAAAASNGCVPSATLGCPAFPDYPATIEDTDSYVAVYDLDLAKEYLDQSSYNGESLNIVCRSDESLKNMAVAVQALLQQIGVTAEITALEDSLLNSTLVDENAWDLTIAYYGGSTCAGSFNRYFNRNSWSNNMALGFVDDDQLQSLYEEFVSVDTHTDEVFWEFVNYITDNAYYMPLNYSSTYVVGTTDLVEAPGFSDVFCLLNAADYYLD